MSTPVIDPSPPGARTAPPSRSHGLFRAFWRWHFYASFVVIPVFTLLAVTGLIYLFRFQLEPLMHPEMHAPKPTGVSQQQPLGAQLDAVERRYPDAEVTLVREGRGLEDSTAFTVTRADGSSVDVFVDPWRSKVLGAVDPDTTLSGYAVRLHADLMAGRFGDRLIEVAVCWGLVMAVTGYYLFVVGRRARLRRVAKRAKGALLRHRHGLVGAVAGVGLLTMLITGLPWTGVWGAQVQRLATSQGTSLWSMDPGAASKPGSTLDESLPHSHAVQVPWAQQKSPVPESDPKEGRVSVANLDTAVAAAERAGIERPVAVVMPGDSRGVYSVMADAFHDPSRERTVHVDRFSGQVRATYGFADYPLPAKVVSQGIGLHEGRSLGLLSFWTAAAFCVAVLFMCVTGPLMWWRRRPRGSLGAPRGRMPIRSTWWLAAILVVLGVALPLFGITLLAVLLLDQLVIRRVPALREHAGSA